MRFFSYLWLFPSKTLPCPLIHTLGLCWLVKVNFAEVFKGYSHSVLTQMTWSIFCCKLGEKVCVVSDWPWGHMNLSWLLFLKFSLLTLFSKAYVIYNLHLGLGFKIQQKCLLQCRSQEQTPMPRRVSWFIFNLWIKNRISHWHNYTVTVIVAYGMGLFSLD